MENSKFENLNIGDLTPEQRAILAEQLKQENGGKVSPEVTSNLEVPKAGVQASGSEANPEAVQPVVLGAEQSERKPAEVIDISTGNKAKGILNRFFEGEESFEDLDVTEKNVADVVAEMEEWEKKKAA